MFGMDAIILANGDAVDPEIEYKITLGPERSISASNVHQIDVLDEDEGGPRVVLGYGAPNQMWSTLSIPFQKIEDAKAWADILRKTCNTPAHVRARGMEVIDRSAINIVGINC